MTGLISGSRMATRVSQIQMVFLLLSKSQLLAHIIVLSNEEIENTPSVCLALHLLTIFKVLPHISL